MLVCATVKQLTLSLLLLLALNANAATPVFSVNNAVVSAVGNGYVLNATIHYPLTPRVIEALDNGVPITFYQELELSHVFPVFGDIWQWRSTRWQSTLRFELRYHALVQQYVVLSLDTDTQQNFPTLDSALMALGHVENMSLPAEHTINTKNLELRIRSGIDLHALPTPMRPGALLSSKWQLSSPWVRAAWR